VWPSAGFIRPQMPSNEPALDESPRSVSQSREKPHQSNSPGQTMTPSAADEAAAGRFYIPQNTHGGQQREPQPPLRNRPDGQADATLGIWNLCIVRERFKY
jgi:hypothetical protein